MWEVHRVLSVRHFIDATLLRKHSASFGYSLTSLILHVSSLVASLVAMKYVQPSELGWWSSVMLFEVVATALRMGIVNGLNRELPICLSRGQPEDCSDMVGSVEAYTLWSNLIMIPAFALFALGADLEGIPLGVMVAGLLVNLSNSHLAIALGTYRSGGDFKRLSGLQLILALYRVGSLVLVVLWGIRGFVGREVLYAVLYLALAYWQRPVRSRPRWDARILRMLMKVGLPVFAGSYALSIAAAIPRSILVLSGAMHEIGLLSATMTLAGVGTVLVDSASMYFYPEMSRQSGAGAKGGEMWALYLSALRIGAIMVLPTALVGSVFGAMLLRAFLPAYAEAAGILYLGFMISVFSLFRFGFTLLATMKQWRRLTILVSGVLLSSALAPGVAYRVYGSLESLLVGQCIAGGIGCVIATVICYQATHEGVEYER